MNAFIDEHRARCGVEPICSALQVAPSAYRRYAARQRNPALLSARARRDAILLSQVQRVYAQNLQVYGADKVWRQLRREGTAVARCTVERLMRLCGLSGARRGKKVRTTVPDAKAACPLDRVKRHFKADRPNQLWVADFSAPCRRGLQQQEKGETTDSKPKLADSRPTAEMLSRTGGGRAKGGRKAWPFADGWVSCAERPELYRATVARSARRATTRSMVRQRSVRWKPLYLQLPTVGNDGDSGAIRPCLMFAAGGCDLYALDDGVLPWPSSGATRGRARHLRT
ncbi:putative transposase OrfB (plasmid) [Variovorax sp. WDL1]|nr:hypothetical protein CHC07_08024 [Variovorax sp. B4]VTV19173.1 putative transposase OrfB [Variovorax sp. WDL1]